MLANIAYLSIFGKPLIFYLGILTFLSFLFTAFIAVLNVRFKNQKIPFKWHRRMAAVSFILAFIHGLLAISVYLF